MIPELILKEEEEHHYVVLSLIGFFSVLGGFAAANTLYPTHVSMLTVVFAAIPLVYPLMKFFLDEGINEDSYVNEIVVYFSLFTGQVIGFILLSTMYPDLFEIQLDIVGAAGYATNPSAAFFAILSNNLIVYFSILVVSAIIGSSGAFILTWNASVLGVFFSHLISGIERGAYFACGPDVSQPSPLCFLPHASLEMLGFILAGITGTLISISVYRKDFSKDTLRKIMVSVTIGFVLIVVAAVLESF